MGQVTAVELEAQPPASRPTSTGRCVNSPPVDDCRPWMSSYVSTPVGRSLSDRRWVRWTGRSEEQVRDCEPVAQLASAVETRPFAAAALTVPQRLVLGRRPG